MPQGFQLGMQFATYGVLLPVPAGVRTGRGQLPPVNQSKFHSLTHLVRLILKAENTCLWPQVGFSGLLQHKVIGID